MPQMKLETSQAMENLVKVCDVDSLPAGEMMSVDLEGFPPLAVYNVDGKFQATSNICTHNVARLTDGYLDGNIIECPLHGGCFNVLTGEATHPPCYEPLKIYEVVVKNGSVFINMQS